MRDESKKKKKKLHISFRKLFLLLYSSFVVSDVITGCCNWKEGFIEFCLLSRVVNLTIMSLS